MAQVALWPERIDSPRPSARTCPLGGRGHEGLLSSFAYAAKR